MSGPGAAQLLDVWERGLAQDPVRRALTLLAAAVPQTEATELASWSLGRRDAALLAFRAELFGPDLAALAHCPGCGLEVELSFTAEDALPGEPYGQAKPVTVRRDGHELTLRALTSNDLLSLDLTSSNSVSSEDASAEAALTARCITSASTGGVAVNPAALPHALLVALGEELGRVDPGAATELSVMCPGCRHRWLAPFHIASYLWTELHHRARRLLMEVHILARAYGWTEPDILALTARRRQAYLELVAQ